MKRRDNYQIIRSLASLQDFVDWLPELMPGEVYYLSLLARAKYSEQLGRVKSDKAQLKRFTSDKSRLIDKIAQLECEVGSYKLKGIPVPEEALALYITVNPRSMTRAAKSSVLKLMNLVTAPYNGYNPHQEVLSEIQRSKSRTVYSIFDFDFSSGMDESVLIKYLQDTVNSSAVRIIRTRGGYHVLIQPNLVMEPYKKSWYKRMMLIPGLDKGNRGSDMMIPVVGCCQGDFVPYFSY